MSEKIAKKVYNIQVEKINASDREYQDAINKKEHQFVFVSFHYFFQFKF